MFVDVNKIKRAYILSILIYYANSISKAESRANFVIWTYT